MVFNTIIRNIIVWICKIAFVLNKERKSKYSEEFKKEVIKLYLGNMGIRSIERLKGVNNTTVINWIRKFGKKVKENVRDLLNRSYT